MRISYQVLHCLLYDNAIKRDSLYNCIFSLVHDRYVNRPLYVHMCIHTYGYCIIYINSNS